MAIDGQKVFHFQHGKQSFDLAIFPGTGGADIAEAVRARFDLAADAPLVAKLGKVEVPLTFSLPNGARLSLQVAGEPKRRKAAARKAPDRQGEALTPPPGVEEAIEDTDLAGEDPTDASGPESAAVLSWERERRRLQGLLRQGATRECDRLQRLLDEKQRSIIDVGAEHQRAMSDSKAARKAQSDAEARVSELQRRAVRAESKMEDLRARLSTKELEADQFEDALRQATAEVKAVSAKLEGRSPAEPGESSPPKKSAAAGRVLASGHPRATGYPATSGYPSTSPPGIPDKSTGASRGKGRTGQIREGARGDEAEAGSEAGVGHPKPKRTGRSADAPPASVFAQPGPEAADIGSRRGPATWTGGRVKDPAGQGEESVRPRRGAAASRSDDARATDVRAADVRAGDARAGDAQAAPAARGRPVPVEQRDEEEGLGTDASDEEEGDQATESSVASGPQSAPPHASYATSMADDDVEESDVSGSEEHEESQLSEEESLADSRLDEEEYDDNEGSIGPLETEESEDEMPALQN